LSNSVAGFILDEAGFSSAFLFLAACALGAFLLLWIAMPETGKGEPQSGREASSPQSANRRSADGADWLSGRLSAYFF
jgi:predicted MFS family arabinose efflux permease